MRRSASSVLLSLLVMLAAAPARAAEVPEGAVWTQHTIGSAGGVELHADVLRPKHLPEDARTPVILAVGPYFNHAGQVGAAGPAQNEEYEPVGAPAGPSDRFHDLVEDARLMERGYTFVMVDLRGFGGSTGCLDWGGPGEQADVVSAVEWAARQPWSTGAVGMYGKSYDAVTGLIGVNLAPAGLKAVVAQEPVYDLYRYLYGDGMRRLNSLATPALYDVIAATPGPLGDAPAYIAASVNDPVCLARNAALQSAEDEHGSAYWRTRNLIPGAKGSQVPLFLTQGLTENNTVADGMGDYLENHTGPERAWLGPWEHVRGGDRDDEDRLEMGREGWYDEVLRFYDLHLRGVQPEVQDPPVAVQTNDGRWRAEAVWPPADRKALTTALRPGEYRDAGTSYSTGSDPTATSGVWTISEPLPYDVHLAGDAKAVVDVVTSLPRANLAVDVYDLDRQGEGPLVTRQGHMIRKAGRSRLELELWSADWKIPAGHRIGVRVTETNQDWWLLTVGTQQPVEVAGGSITLPFLTLQRNETIQGDPGTQLEGYLENTVTVPEGLLAGAETPFSLPGPMVPPAPVAAGGAPTRPAAARLLTARLRAAKQRRLVVRGRGVPGMRLTVRVRRGGKTVATRRVTVRRSGTYRRTIRLRRAGRYGALVTGMAGGERLRVRARSVRVR